MREACVPNEYCASSTLSHLVHSIKEVDSSRPASLEMLNLLINRIQSHGRRGIQVDSEAKQRHEGDQGGTADVHVLYHAVGVITGLWCELDTL